MEGLVDRYDILDTMKLSKKKCIPCEDKTMKPFTKRDALVYIKKVSGWKLEKTIKISRTFLFNNFKKALVFVNSVGKIAEKEGHHPDIFIWYNKVILELWTHSIGGLSENDFIIAAKVNDLIKD